MGTLMTSGARELYFLIASREKGSQTWRPLIAAALGFANIVLCAYFERSLWSGESREGFATLLAIETALIVALAMGVHLQTAEPVLNRTRIHPLDPASRFRFVLLTLLRNSYLLAFGASSVFSLTLMLHPSPAKIPAVVLAFLLPQVAFIIASAALVIMIARWTGSGALALAIVGMIACLTAAAAIVYPESATIDHVLPLRWWAHGCTSALHGAYLSLLGWLTPFAAMIGVAWFGGRRYA
jgi:hypothetical protein